VVAGGGGGMKGVVVCTGGCWVTTIGAEYDEYSEDGAGVGKGCWGMKGVVVAGGGGGTKGVVVGIGAGA